MKILGYILIGIAVLSGIGSLMSKNSSNGVEVFGWVIRIGMFIGGILLIDKANKKSSNKETPPQLTRQSTEEPKPQPVKIKTNSIAAESSKSENLEEESNSFMQDVFMTLHNSAERIVKREYLMHKEYFAARLEAVLLFVYVSTRILKKRIPFTENGLEEELHGILFEYIHKGKHFKPFDFEIPIFITNRFKMYQEDLKEHKNDSSWIMAQSIHAIYYEPLKYPITIENCFLNRDDLSRENPIVLLFAKMVFSEIPSLKKQLLELIEIHNDSKAEKSDPKSDTTSPTMENKDKIPNKRTQEEVDIIMADIKKKMKNQFAGREFWKTTINPPFGYMEFMKKFENQVNDLQNISTPYEIKHKMPVIFYNKVVGHIYYTLSTKSIGVFILQKTAIGTNGVEVKLNERTILYNTTADQLEYIFKQLGEELTTNPEFIKIAMDGKN